MISLRSSCEQILRAHDRGGYTVPSGHVYPHQWAWDSAFAAIGWAHLSPDRATAELETLLAAQWQDGRIPHIVFHSQSDSYFPGPDVWGHAASSSITQPPVWAIAARRIVELGGPNDRVAALLPRIEASHQFFHQQRDPLGWGVIAVAHPWESGMDNAPVWDAPLARVDTSGCPPFQRRDLSTVGDASVRPTDADYRAYITLVHSIANDDFGPGPFAVYDPFMSALLARAERDLAWLQERIGTSTDAPARADALTAKMVEHLFDPERGRFLYHDAKADEALTSHVIGGYAPLFAVEPTPGKPGPYPEIAFRLRQGLASCFSWTRYPLPTTSPNDPAFDSRRYWRGPSWVSVNWLMAPWVDAPLARELLALIREHGCWEYFDPRTGDPLGAPEFTWTAALALDWLTPPA